MSRFSETEIAALYRVMRERQAMRHFLPDPIDPRVVIRLQAAPA